MARKNGDESIWQLHISLKHTAPPIWRRVLVPASATLEDLHYVIQRSFDWDGEHLHGFRARSLPSADPGGPQRRGWTELPIEGYEDEVTLVELGFTESSKFQYIYDYGDNWEHELKLEKILDRDPNTRYPVCIKAARAAPIEDCGGMWGYYNMVDALADPEHPDHEHYVEWWGEETLDTEAVDIDEINAELKRIKL